MIASFGLFLTSCADDDPPPVVPQETAVEHVKITMNSSWMFDWVSVKIGEWSIATTTCDKSQFKLKFTDAEWNQIQSITPIVNITFKGSLPPKPNAADINYQCLTENLTVESTYTISKLSINEARISFSTGEVFDINVDDIKATTITATLIAVSTVQIPNDYKITYQFKR